jgi:protein-S-isoprenylcysteine O-methyltransferase Ste14
MIRRPHTHRSEYMSLSKPEPTVVHGNIRDYRRSLLRAIVFGAIAVFAVTKSAWPAEGVANRLIVWTGVVLIIVCLLGRIWSRFYLSWGAARGVIDTGPYSLCRNPLYDFAILGAAGVGALTGSLTISALSGCIVWVVFFIVALKEEEDLLQTYGEPYRAYLREVPRFLPRFSRWRDVERVEVRVEMLNNTLLDGSLFLVAIPVTEIIKLLQNADILPVLLTLY